MICDNALLIAYASAKRQVSAEVVEEVARDLNLSVPSKTQPTGLVVDLQRPKERDEVSIHEPRVDDTRRTEFEESFIEERPPKLQPKRKAKIVGIGIFLSLVLMTGIGGIIYSQENRDFASDVAARVEDFSEQSGNYILDMTVKMERQGREYLSDAAMKAGDYSELSRNYLSALIGKIKEYSPQSDKLSLPRSRGNGRAVSQDQRFGC